MARPRKGIAFTQAGTTRTGVRLRDGKRWTCPVADVAPTPKGTDAIEWARSISLQLQKRYDVGEWDPHAPTHVPTDATTHEGPLTVGQWCRRWVLTQEYSSIEVESGYFRYLDRAPLAAVPLSSATRDELAAFVDWLRTQPSKRGGVLAPRTVRSVWDVLRRALRDAHEAGLAPLPALPRRKLPGITDKSREWRVDAIFTAAEAGQLISDPRIPIDRRVLYSLLVFTGLRLGEALALRWCDLDLSVLPLGRLQVHSSKEHRTGRRKSTKSGAVRQIPVHPALAKILTHWRGHSVTVVRDGHEQSTRIADLPAVTAIVPKTTIRQTGGTYEDTSRVGSSVHKRWTHDLAVIGLRHRRIHDTRRTFVSLARDGGADDGKLKWISHGGDKRSMVDLYSGLAWPTLCAQVTFLNVGTAEGSVTGSVTAPFSTESANRESQSNPTTFSVSELRARQDSNLWVWPNLSESGFKFTGFGAVGGDSVTGFVTDVIAPRGDAVADLWALAATLGEGAL